MLTFPIMVLGLMILLLVAADSTRRQFIGSNPALTAGHCKWATAGIILLVGSFLLLPTVAFVEYLLG